jgi:hypothetical protein
MHFPLIKYRYTCQNTAADKQQGNPQSKVACIAGLRRFGIVLPVSGLPSPFFTGILFSSF